MSVKKPRHERAGPPSPAVSRTTTTLRAHANGRARPGSAHPLPFASRTPGTAFRVPSSPQVFSAIALSAGRVDGAPTSIFFSDSRWPSTTETHRRGRTCR